jgi:hypothetical protein
MILAVFASAAAAVFAAVPEEAAPAERDPERGRGSMVTKSKRKT